MPLPARYQPARALPSQPYLPGRTPRPRPDASGEPPGDWEAYLWGVDLYNYGYFWEAHEVWEALWRRSQSDVARRTFLQGLIQCSAACLKLQLGDAEACSRLATRGLARLHALTSAEGRCMGLPLARFVADFRAFVESPSPDVTRRPLLVIAA